jgi:Fe-S cluster biogenesis protein NfuA
MDIYENGGYVFVNEGLGTGHQAIAFKIDGNCSDCVSVGMGLTDIIKIKQYLLSGIV